MSVTSPREVLAALAAAVAADPARWPGRDGYQPGGQLDGLRDGEWLHVLPAAWARITGRPGAAVLAVLHDRGDLAVLDSARSKGEWAAKGPRWAGRPTGYRIRLAALTDPAPDPDPAITAWQAATRPPGRREASAAAPGVPAAFSARLAPDTDPAAPSWRDGLGAEIPGMQCPDECPCGGAGVIRYASGGTGAVCEECGPQCWVMSPAATDRAGEYDTAERQLAVRERKASAQISQSEIDEADRVIRRDLRDRTGYIDRALQDQRISADTRTDLEWFRDAYAGTKDPARIAELDCQLDSMEVPRKGFLGWLLGPRALAAVAGLSEDDKALQVRETDRAEQWARFTDPAGLPSDSDLLAAGDDEGEPIAPSLHRDFTDAAFRILAARTPADLHEAVEDLSELAAQAMKCADIFKAEQARRAGQDRAADRAGQIKTADPAPGWAFEWADRLHGQGDDDGHDDGGQGGQLVPFPAGPHPARMTPRDLTSAPLLACVHCKREHRQAGGYYPRAVRSADLPEDGEVRLCDYHWQIVYGQYGRIITTIRELG